MNIKNEQQPLKEEEQPRPLFTNSHNNKDQPLFSSYLPHFPPSVQPFQSYYEPYDDLHYLPFHYDGLSLRSRYQYYDRPVFPRQPFYGYEEELEVIKKQQEHDEYGRNWANPQIKQQQAVIHPQFTIEDLKREEEDASQSNFNVKYPQINKYFSLKSSPESQLKNSIRRKKVQAYLEKKKMCCYSKKVIYKCRKDVADARIRYKGRFLSLKQAVQILGLNPCQKFTALFLKDEIHKLSKDKP